jgi:acyl-CoA thioester hydrolase
VLIEKATGKLVRVPAEVAAPFLYETRRKEENE